MRSTLFILIVMLSSLMGCKKPADNLIYKNPDLKIIFLHHSTGMNIWKGGVNNNKWLTLHNRKKTVPGLIKEYNKKTGKKINIVERNFPKGNPYPWNNYPYDYYNIWVKHEGNETFMEEPTLELLTKEYDIIIFKHCFPVSKIEQNDDKPDINSDKKTLANYKLQYNALKEKMHQFPNITFLIWTGAALVESQTTKHEAQVAREFSDWVISEWDQSKDNIEIFDFREIETQGGLYLLPEFAASNEDSHPNTTLSSIAANLLVNKIISITE